MDWGATIIFVLSIIGAVLLSGGDMVVGVIAFIVILCILAAIKGILKSIPKPPKPPKPEHMSAKIILDEQHFVLIHEQVLKFLQAFSSKLPSEWYHYFISQEYDHIGNSTEGYLKFEILLGNWWDELLYDKPEIKDYIMSVFEFDANEKTFMYRIRTGICHSGSYPADEITKMLHTYLDNYEATHTCLHLTRESYGAKYSNI